MYEEELLISALLDFPQYFHNYYNDTFIDPFHTYKRTEADGLEHSVKTHDEHCLHVFKVIISRFLYVGKDIEISIVYIDALKVVCFRLIVCGKGYRDFHSLHGCIKSRLF